MIIIKTLGQDTFSWNPNAFNKRGHWFLLAETGSYIRIATKQETNKLGKPKKQDENQIDVKTGEKKMSYQRAAEIRKKSLRNLITDKLVEGEGIGSSIGGSISEKMKAKATGFKEKLDPMNIAKMLTGKLGSALLGKITGRSKEDISYFAGGNKAKQTKSKPSYVNTSINKSDTALYSAIAEGNNQSMKKGDGIATVLARMYNLIKFQQIESIKRFQIEKNFKKIKEKQKEKWNKQLIEALTNKKTATIITEDKKEESGGFFDGIFKYITDKIQAAYDWVANIISGIWGGLGKIISIITAVGGFLAFEDIIKKVKSFFGMGDKTIPSESEITKKNKTKDLSKTKEESKKTSKLEKPKDKPKTTKISKELTSAKGILRYLRKIPMGVLAGIAGGINLIMDVEQLITKKENGEISDKELKKEVITKVSEVIGGVGGAVLGSTIGRSVGAIAGSVVPVVGTAAGGTLGHLGGGVLGGIVGSKVGKYTTEKLYDMLSESDIDPVIPEASLQEQELVKSTQQTKSSGVDKSMVPSVIKDAMQENGSTTSTSSDTTSGTSTQMPQTAVAVPSPNPTDDRLQATINANDEIKNATEASVNTYEIDQSQTIGATGGGGSGGVVVESSASVRSDEPTLREIQRQNLRTN